LFNLGALLKLTLKHKSPYKMCIIIYKRFACCRPEGQEAHATYVFSCQTDLCTLVPAGQRPRMCPDVYTLRLENKDPSRKCQFCAPPSCPTGSQEPHTDLPSILDPQRVTIRVNHHDSSDPSKTDHPPTREALSAGAEKPHLSTQGAATNETARDSFSPSTANVPPELNSFLVGVVDSKLQPTPHTLGDLPSREPLFLPSENLPLALRSFFVELVNGCTISVVGTTDPIAPLSGTCWTF